MSEYLIKVIIPIVLPIFLIIIGAWVAIWQARETQLLQHKRDVFVEAIQLIDKHLNAQKHLRTFGGDFAGHVPLDDVPTADINRIISQLVMLSDSDKIVTMFVDFFGPTIGGDILIRRGDFIKLLQLNLYKEETMFSSNRIPFHVNKTAPPNR